MQRDRAGRERERLGLGLLGGLGVSCLRAAKSQLWLGDRAPKTLNPCQIRSLAARSFPFLIGEAP